MDTPIPRFDLWIPAIETGLLPLSQLVAWADTCIERLSQPPAWIIELCLAKDLEGVRQARELVNSQAPASAGNAFDKDRIYLGSLYIAYERGRMHLEDLLLSAGAFTDVRVGDGLPPCEAFYALLAELMADVSTRMNDREFLGRVRDIFAPMAELARAAIVVPADECAA